MGFQAFLQLDTRQRAAGVVLLGRDADDDTGVGVTLIARVLAHAVGYHAVRLAGGGDHSAAWAHAEAVHRATVLGVVHQLVVGGADLWMPGVLAEAGAVDQRLRMLDTEAHRERLGLHEYTALV